MIVALQPSYWQQIVAGLVVIVPTLILGGFLLGWFRRSVLEPRAAGRRWPEGARGLRPVVEIVVDTQRRLAGGGRPERAAEFFGWGQAIRFGLVVAACAVIPVSTGLVLTQPNLGLYALAVLLVGDAFVSMLGWRDDAGSLACLLRCGLAAVIGLMGGVVHAQWGTASVAEVVAAQANGAIGGISSWGLPTLAVHPLAYAVAIGACFMTMTLMASSRAAQAGGTVGLVAQLVNQAWTIAMSAWLVATFAGGGAVPWGIDNPGTRQVVSVVLFATKTLLAALGFAWVQATWPRRSVRGVRVLLVAGALVGVSTIGLTLLARHLA